MWHQQDEPKPASAPAEVAVSHAPQPPRNIAALEREPAFVSATLSPGIIIHGEISGQEDIVLDGELSGTVRIPNGQVTVGPHGRVKADIEAREILVRGSVLGALRARERVLLGATGRIRGDIVTRQLVIEEGAEYCGKVEMIRAEEASAPRGVAGAVSGKILRAVPAHASEPDK